MSKESEKYLLNHIEDGVFNQQVLLLVVEGFLPVGALIEIGQRPKAVDLQGQDVVLLCDVQVPVEVDQGRVALSHDNKSIGKHAVHGGHVQWSHVVAGCKSRGLLIALEGCGGIVRIVFYHSSGQQYVVAVAVAVLLVAAELLIPLLVLLEGRLGLIGSPRARAIASVFL